MSGDPSLSGEDLILWSDGAWCYAEDLEDMLRGRSDDYEYIPYGTARWDEVAAQEGIE